jgi:hypothetical protein
MNFDAVPQITAQSRSATLNLEILLCATCPAFIIDRTVEDEITEYVPSRASVSTRTSYIVFASSANSFSNSKLRHQSVSFHLSRTNHHAASLDRDPQQRRSTRSD